jgi:DNA-binding transcriptional LysR family regulator
MPTAELTTRPSGPDLDPRLIAHLIAVADHRDLHRAAAALSLSSRAVSRGIRELERETGEPLLTHAGRGLELTPAGVRVVDGGRRVLHALARFTQAAAEQDAMLSVAHVANSDMLERALSRTRVRAREAVLADDEQLGALHEHRLDVAVCTDPAPPADEIAVALLADDPLVLLGDPASGVVFTAYGALWPAHDAAAAALATASGWAASALGAAAGSGRELGALVRAAGERAALVPASTLPAGGVAGASATPAGAALRWRVAWRADDDRPAVAALVAAAQAVAAGAPSRTLSSRPST